MDNFLDLFGSAYIRIFQVLDICTSKNVVLLVANRERASALSFSPLKIWNMLKCWSIDMRIRTLSRYLAIVKSRALYSSITWPAISYESVKTLRCCTLSSFTSFSLVSMTAHSDWLLVALNKKHRMHLMTTPFEFINMRPAPLPCEFEVPSTWRIQINPKLDDLGGCSVNVSSGSLFDHVHLIRTSTRTWNFMNNLKW